MTRLSTTLLSAAVSATLALAAGNAIAFDASKVTARFGGVYIIPADGCVNYFRRWIL